MYRLRYRSVNGKPKVSRFKYKRTALKAQKELKKEHCSSRLIKVKSKRSRY
jgi:hypothetical protein